MELVGLELQRCSHQGHAIGSESLIISIWASGNCVVFTTALYARWTPVSGSLGLDAPKLAWQALGQSW